MAEDVDSGRVIKPGQGVQGVIPEDIGEYFLVFAGVVRFCTFDGGV